MFELVRLLSYLQVTADGNAQLQKLVDVAKQSSSTGAVNATALLANMSGIAAVQQGSMAQEVRSISTNVGQSLQSDPNYAVPATFSALQTLKSNFTGDALAQKVAATGLTAQNVQDNLNGTLPVPPPNNSPVAPAPTNMNWVAGVVIGVVVGVALIVVGALWYTGKISLPILGRREAAGPSFDAADRYAVADQGPVAEGVRTSASGADHPSTPRSAARVNGAENESGSARAAPELPQSEDRPERFVSFTSSQAE